VAKTYTPNSTWDWLETLEELLELDDELELLEELLEEL
jgi:hypothetical protein